MIGEFNIAGVFVPTSIVGLIAAIAISILLRRVLHIFGFYRLVWHRGLFDLALIAIVWGSITAVAYRYGSGAPGIW
jgi:hypothetical protein